MSVTYNGQVSQNPYTVLPLGFLLGVMAACVFYGLHITQIHRYYNNYWKSDGWRLRSLVAIVFSLSTMQQVISWTMCGHYFIGGISHPQVWGTFHWALSCQDGLVPLIALVAQLFYGRRIWGLYDRRFLVGLFFFIVPTLNFLLGISMAVMSYFWAKDPYDPHYEMRTKPVSRIATDLPIVWICISALLDGIITLTLMIHFRKISSPFISTQQAIRRLMRLTMETVFITHIMGGVMAITFLISHTKTDVFWVFYELVTECYALSILFTINARASSRQSFQGERLALDFGSPLSHVLNFDPKLGQTPQSRFDPGDIEMGKDYGISSEDADGLGDEDDATRGRPSCEDDEIGKGGGDIACELPRLGKYSPTAESYGIEEHI